MSQVNRKATPTWDGKAKGIKGNKLQSSAWESVIAIFWFLVGVIGAACNFILKNKKNILEFSSNVTMLFGLFYSFKGEPKVKNRRPRYKKK